MGLNESLCTPDGIPIFDRVIEALILLIFVVLGAVSLELHIAKVDQLHDLVSVNLSAISRVLILLASFRGGIVLAQIKRLIEVGVGAEIGVDVEVSRIISETE